jgi:hypothetical protein
MKTLGKLGLLCSLIAIFAFSAPVSASDKFSDEWNISVSGNAVTAGTISFKLTFEPGDDGSTRDPVTIETAVAANSSEDDIVGLLGDSISTALGDDDFDVDISWGEKIEVKAEGSTPEFSLTITGNTLKDVKIEIKE